MRRSRYMCRDFTTAVFGYYDYGILPCRVAEVKDLKEIWFFVIFWVFYVCLAVAKFLQNEAIQKLTPISKTRFNLRLLLAVRCSALLYCPVCIF